MTTGSTAMPTALARCRVFMTRNSLRVSLVLFSGIDAYSSPAGLFSVACCSAFSVCHTASTGLSRHACALGLDRPVRRVGGESAAQHAAERRCVHHGELSWL